MCVRGRYDQHGNQPSSLFVVGKKSKPGTWYEVDLSRKMYSCSAWSLAQGRSFKEDVFLFCVICIYIAHVAGWKLHDRAHGPYVRSVVCRSCDVFRNGRLGSRWDHDLSDLVRCRWSRAWSIWSVRCVDCFFAVRCTWALQGLWTTRKEE